MLAAGGSMLGLGLSRCVVSCAPRIEPEDRYNAHLATSAFHSQYRFIGDGWVPAAGLTTPLRAWAQTSTGKSMDGVRALFFDVFGTLVDWRTGVEREAKTILEPLGYSLDWVAFADA